VSKRGEYRKQLNEELNGYDINVNRVLKRNSKNLDRLKEAKRQGKQSYRRRRSGYYIFKGQRFG